MKPRIIGPIDDRPPEVNPKDRAIKRDPIRGKNTAGARIPAFVGRDPVLPNDNDPFRFRGIDRMTDLSDVRAGLVPREPKEAPRPYRHRDGRLAKCDKRVPPMTGRTDRRETGLLFKPHRLEVQIIRGGKPVKTVRETMQQKWVREGNVVGTE